VLGLQDVLMTTRDTQQNSVCKGNHFKAILDLLYMYQYQCV